MNPPPLYHRSNFPEELLNQIEDLRMRKLLRGMMKYDVTHRLTIDKIVDELDKMVRNINEFHSKADADEIDDIIDDFEEAKH